MTAGHGPDGRSPEVRQARFAGAAVDVRAARRFVADAFESLGLAGQAHHAALATSELASNVVNHACSAFTVRVVDRLHDVTVEVHDDSPVLPRRRHPTPAEPSGRGLAIVDRCSGRWGARPAEAPGTGKVVWFAIDKATEAAPTSEWRRRGA